MVITAPSFYVRFTTDATIQTYGFRFTAYVWSRAGVGWACGAPPARTVLPAATTGALLRGVAPRLEGPPPPPLPLPLPLPLPRAAPLSTAAAPGPGPGPGALGTYATGLCAKPAPGADVASTWTGVTCRGGTVVGLSLAQLGVTGTLPTSLGLLTALTYLDLSQNKLQGTLPSALGLMTSLLYLDLSGNSLRCAINVGPPGNTQNPAHHFISRHTNPPSNPHPPPPAAPRPYLVPI